MKKLSLTLFIGVILALGLFTQCEKDELTTLSAEETAMLDERAPNTCTKQVFNFSGKKVKVEILRCSENCETAIASITTVDVKQAILDKFGVDNSFCSEETCNNAEKECVIGEPTGTVKIIPVTVADCMPTGEICEDSGNPIHKITIQVTKYAVSVKCHCV